MPELKQPAKPQDSPTNTQSLKMPKHVGPGVSGSKNDFARLQPTNKVEFHMPENVLKKWQNSMNKSQGGFKK